MEEDWNDTFYDLFREAVGRYHEGHRNVDGFFTDQEIIFLSSIGCRTRELFDFVETYARTGEPSPTTVLLMAAARRDFFLTVQYGQFYQGKPVIGYDLPGFGDELCGLPYLPRLIAKARAKPFLPGSRKYSSRRLPAGGLGSRRQRPEGVRLRTPAHLECFLCCSG